MLRVCNLCLDKLANVDEDDDDDRHSVVSSVASFPAHQYPQSPFAAAKMFGRPDGPFAMFSIPPTTYRPQTSFRDGKATPWRGETPDDSMKENAAPFRRRLSDEEKDSNRVGMMSLVAESPTIPSYRPAVSFPKSILNEQSTVQFPVGSPEQLPDSLRPASRLKLVGSLENVDETPFIRSRTQSRLEGVTLAEAGWRTPTREYGVS